MNRRRFLITVIAAGLALLVVIVITSVVTAAVNSNDASETSTDIREAQTENSPLLKRINRITQTLEDCTTPGGKCYERSRAQTAATVGSINAVNLAGIYCRDQVLDDVYTYRELAHCVTKVNGTKGRTP